MYGGGSFVSRLLRREIAANEAAYSFVALYDPQARLRSPCIKTASQVPQTKSTMLSLALKIARTSMARPTKGGEKFEAGGSPRVRRWTRRSSKLLQSVA
jgi:hypothetical protein